MQTIVCFGELLLRLSPAGHARIAQAGSFDASFGGAEANVAVSLAQFGHQSRLVTRLPENPLGDAALAALRARGVDTASVLRGGSRIGVYYLEHGAALRPSRVLYDRAHSACSMPHHKVNTGQEQSGIEGNPAAAYEVSCSPEPFAISTTIRYRLPEDTRIRLVVYSLLGRQISVLENGEKTAGLHNAVFHAPHDLPNGVYYYVLSSATGRTSGPMHLVR